MAWAVSVDAMAYIRGNISNTYLRLKLLFQLAVVIYLPARFLLLGSTCPISSLFTAPLTFLLLLLRPKILQKDILHT